MVLVVIYIYKNENKFFAKSFNIPKGQENQSFLRKEYRYIFSSNTESSLEKQKWNFAFLKKANNSIATKLCANLLNDR